MRSSSLAFALLAALLPACSEPAPVDPDMGNGPDKPSDVVTLVCGLMRAACERQVACGYPLVNNSPGDADACLAAQRCASVAVELDAPDIVVDPVVVERCTSAIEAATCGELAAQGLGIDPSCERYVTGARAEGESCRGGTVSDCAAGLACVFEGDVCPGTCTRVSASGGCSEGSCGPNAFCASDGACKERAAIGEACDELLLDFANLSDSPCVAGAHCESSACVADLDLGAACVGMHNRACGEGAACLCADPASCASEADYACRAARAEGEACNMAFDCGEGLYCDFGDGGRCARRGGPGAACGDSFGACMHPLHCVEGACAGDEPFVAELPLLEEGESCVGEGACPLGTACTCDDAGCVEKRCLPAPGLGASCQEQMLANYTAFACAEGLCDLFAGYTCVQPAAAGEPCPVDGLTLACASLVCVNGSCASLEETRCVE